MATLDDLRAMREALTALFELEPDELRALVNQGYSGEPPANYANLTNEQWAAGDLAWIAEAARLLAALLNPEPGETVMRLTGTPGQWPSDSQ